VIKSRLQRKKEVVYGKRDIKVIGEELIRKKKFPIKNNQNLTLQITIGEIIKINY